MREKDAQSLRFGKPIVLVPIALLIVTLSTCWVPASDSGSPAQPPTIEFRQMKEGAYIAGSMLYDPSGEYNHFSAMNGTVGVSIPVKLSRYKEEIKTGEFDSATYDAETDTYTEETVTSQVIYTDIPSSVAYGTLRVKEISLELIKFDADLTSDSGYKNETLKDMTVQSGGSIDLNKDGAIDISYGQLALAAERTGMADKQIMELKFVNSVENKSTCLYKAATDDDAEYPKGLFTINPSGVFLLNGPAFALPDAGVTTLTVDAAQAPAILKGDCIIDYTNRIAKIVTGVTAAGTNFTLELEDYKIENALEIFDVNVDGTLDEITSRYAAGSASRSVNVFPPIFKDVSIDLLKGQGDANNSLRTCQ